MTRLFHAGFLFAIATSAVACEHAAPHPRVPAKFSKAMPVPPILEPAIDGDRKIYRLSVDRGSTMFLDGGATPTLTYNGGVPGPTIRLRQNDRVVVRISNHLDQGEKTNVHWHGMRIPASADGPHNDIDPGGSFESVFTVIQPAATLWYHPHWGNSGRQTYLGLAGFLYVEDARSDALPLPRDYGVNDFPLLVQDKSFFPDGRLAYLAHPATDEMLGDEFLVNGAINPFLSVPQGLVRLRLLNGSNARRYRFAFEDGRSFSLIASDGGFLEAPVSVSSLMMAPAERAEILVDFSRDAAAARTKLVSQPFDTSKSEKGPRVFGKKQIELSPTGVGTAFPILEFRVAAGGKPLDVPRTLVPIQRIPETAAQTTRTFHLGSDGHQTINDLEFDMNRIDFTVKPNAIETWTIVNDDPTEYPHSFHVHGVQFLVLERRNAQGPLQVPPLESGWKDTVVVPAGESIRIIAGFHDLVGMYMFHCHVLEHENLGMMGTFVVPPVNPVKPVKPVKLAKAGR